MKITFNFDLSNDEDEIQYDLYYKQAKALYLSLTEFERYIRSEWKYPPEDRSQETQDKVDEIRDTFYRIVLEQGAEI